VDDEAKSLTAEGPVISVSCVNGSLKKVTPSPNASNLTCDLLAAVLGARSRTSAPPAGSR
jgi:hypothetical protein